MFSRPVSLIFTEGGAMPRLWPQNAGWWLSGALAVAALGITLVGFRETIPILLGELVFVISGIICLVLTVKKQAKTPRQKRWRRIQIAGACILTALLVLSPLALAPAAVRRMFGGVDGPALRVASALEPDNEHRVFRLSVWNEGGGLGIAEASLAWLKGGEQTHDAIMPLKLGVIHLSRREQGKMGIVLVDQKADVLMVGNSSYLRHLKIHSAKGDIIPASFCVRVIFLGTDVFHERTFRLIPDKNASLLYRAELVAPSCS